MDQTVDVLVFAAHPDDAEISVGGTLLKLASLGYRTGVIDMTRGESGTRGTAAERAEEAAEAAVILKLAVRENLELPDSRVACTEAARTAAVRTIRRYRPHLILTHYWEDPHPDHSATSRIVREAAYLAGLIKFDAESGLGRHRPAAIAHFLFPRTVTPSFIVDISDFYEEKVKAIQAYRSQLHDPRRTEPETRLSRESFLRRVEARHRYFGSLIDAEYGEAFFVKEALNVDDPVRLLTRPMNLYS
jgi:bacillithiol biosynthesis deacetylase BshB1